METIEQTTALGKSDGIYYVFVDLKGKRQRVKNEKVSDEHPFIKFANSKNLPDLMIALDEIFTTTVPAHLDFINDLSGAHKPDSVTADDAATVARMFEEKPTRTTIEKTTEAIKVWSLDNTEPSDDALANIEAGLPRLYMCTPLEDVIRAKEDLRQASLMLAWLIGKTDFDKAHGFKRGDKKSKLRLMDTEGDSLLSGYYKNLADSNSNIFNSMNIHAQAGTMHLYDPDAIESTVKCYVEAAFSLLLSDETKKMGYDLRTYTSNNTVVSTMWSFFADGLNAEEGANSIGVCSKCGKFYTQQRATKQFCTDSCRVMQQRSDQDVAPIPETDTMRIRAYIKSLNS